MPEQVPDSLSQYEYKSKADTFSCKDGHFSNAPEYVYDDEANIFVIKVEEDSDTDGETDGQSIAETSSTSTMTASRMPDGASTIYSDTVPTAASTVGVNADHNEANYSILMTRQKLPAPTPTRKILIQSGKFNTGVVA